MVDFRITWTLPNRRSWKQRLPNTGRESVYLFLSSTIVFGFLTILFEKSQPGDRAYSEMSGFGNPSYNKTK